MDFRTNSNGKRRPINKKIRYSNTRKSSYREQLSLISTASEAEDTSKELLAKFNSVNDRDRQLQIKRAIVERANRAKVASRNAKLPQEQRDSEKQIAAIFEGTYKQMVLSPKVNSKSHVLKINQSKSAIADTPSIDDIPNAAYKDAKHAQKQVFAESEKALTKFGRLVESM